MPALRCPYAAALLTAALLASPATGRAATLTVADPLVSIEECTDQSTEEVDLSWDLGSSSGETLELLGSDSSGCSEDDATTAVLVEGLDPAQTTDASVTLADLLGAAGRSTTCEGEDFRVYVCVRLLDSAGAAVTTASAAVRFQLERPPAPEGITVTPGEGALYVGWSAGTVSADAPAVSATYRAFARAGEITAQSAATAALSARVGGLENGTTYEVWAVAYSEAGNPSAASALTTGAPAHVEDFWELYRSAGGLERGGCGAGGGAGALALLLAMVAAARLRRRRAGAALVALLAAAAPDAAAAQEGGRASGSELSLRVQAYRPDLDAGLSASKPYALAFGGRKAWGGRLEYARTATLGGSTLSLGLGAGYLGVRGHGYVRDADTGALTRSGDATALHLLPVSAFLGWRLDLLADRWRVPVVPYARAALERHFWITTGTAQRTHTGATDGYALTVGALLRLDVLDPESGSALAAENGIRLTGLSVDLTRARVDDFGARRSWTLSPRGWTLAGGVLVAF